MRPENGQGYFLVTLGDLQRDVEAYKEYLEIMAQRGLSPAQSIPRPTMHGL